MGFVPKHCSVRYRAAAYLNNSAVTLLKRERYKDAIETFRTSITIMHTLIFDEDTNPICEESINMIPTDYDINYNIQVATHRCATASLTTNDCSLTYENRYELLYFYQQDSCSVIDTILEISQKYTMNAYAFVIIEPLQEDDDICYDLIELACHSILYNYGVTYNLLAYRLKLCLGLEHMIIHQLRQSAFRILCHIEPYFLTKVVWYPSKLDERGILILCILFAQNMYEIANELQYTNICEKYKMMMISYLFSIRHQESFIPTLYRPAPAA